MIDVSTDRSLYVVLTQSPNDVTAYIHHKVGQGRRARRELIAVVHVPRAACRDLTDVLTRVGTQLRLSPSERYRPRV